MENPNSAPIDKLIPHKLWISAARSGYRILFFAEHASIVTSAMATLPDMAVRSNTVMKMCILLCREMTSIEISPRRPAWHTKNKLRTAKFTYDVSDI